MTGDKVQYYKLQEKIVRLKTDVAGVKHVEEYDTIHKYFIKSLTVRPLDVEMRGVPMTFEEILKVGIA